MLSTLDKVQLDTAASLTLATGYTLGWAPGTALYLTDLAGWTGSAPVRRSKADRVGSHGSHGERGFKDERLISVSGHYVGATRAAAAAFSEDVAAFLGDGLRGVFKVEDVDLGVRWADVYLATGGVDVKWTGGVDVDFTVHLLAPDPRKYGTPSSSPATPVPSGSSGLVFPLFAAGALDLGRGGVNGRATASNRGTAPAAPVFTVVATDTPDGFTITNVDTGERLVYRGQVQPGQTLVLDSRRGTVLMDGYAPRGTDLVVAEWSTVGPRSSGTWLFEAPNSTDAYLTVGVTPAWW